MQNEQTVYREGMNLYELIDACRDAARQFGEPRASMTVVARTARLSRVGVYNVASGKAAPTLPTMERLASGLSILSGQTITPQMVQAAANVTRRSTSQLDPKLA